MIKDPRIGQIVIVDYDNEGFDRQATVLAVADVPSRHGRKARVKFLDDGSEDGVWVDFLFEILYTFAGPIMIDWRNGFGSEPV
jgi:hypothetical protein